MRLFCDWLYDVSKHHSFNVSHHPGHAHIKPCGYFLPVVSLGFSFFLCFLIEIAHYTFLLGLCFKIHLLGGFILHSIKAVNSGSSFSLSPCKMRKLVFSGIQMQLSKRQWYIPHRSHPIHFIEKTTCEILIFIELEKSAPGNSIFKFCLLLFAYWCVILLQFLNTDWSCSRVYKPNLSLHIALPLKREGEIYFFRDDWQNCHRHL